jgi:uncharacterized protein (TIGR02270 family)
MQLALQALELHQAHALLQSCAQTPGHLRQLIKGAGFGGDPTYVPWLIKHMSDPATARIAGEAFSLITAVDLGATNLDRKPPEGVELGPSDKVEDHDVAVDRDSGLDWPDPERVTRWWEANRRSFSTRVRIFMGAPLTSGHCLKILREGYQRQRIAAAQYLCLLNPGTPLINTNAPAWRQQTSLQSFPVTPHENA